MLKSTALITNTSVFAGVILPGAIVLALPTKLDAVWLSSTPELFAPVHADAEIEKFVPPLVLPIVKACEAPTCAGME
jgi:hypothetical protein